MSRERVTANLPSNDFDRTAAFYHQLGFQPAFRGDGWMILCSGALEIEFFPLRQNPRKSCFSACIRVDDLDALYERFAAAGLPADCRSMPRLTPPERLHGLRMFALIDPDGNLMRCIENEVIHSIRPVRPDDLAQWSEMRTRLWPDTPDGHRAEIEAYFNGESVDVVHVLVAGAGDGRLAGFLEFNVRNYAEGSRSPRVPYVEGWYVRRAFRGRGLGRALMTAAEAWAREQGFRELASDAELSNRESIAIHRALGFSEMDRVVCFLKALDPESREAEPVRPDGQP